MIAAFDIGGTHAAAARIDPSSATVVPESHLWIELPSDGTREELVGRLVGAAKTVASDDVERCGVAVPAPFDYDRGIFRLRHKLAGLYGVDARRALADPLGVGGSAVTFLNDAAAFLLGEWWAGAARGHTRAVGITLGTGLGSAFLADGRIVRGGSGVPTDGTLYLERFRGAPVEDRISRRGLLARYGDAGVDVVEIAARARRGDDRAREAFRGVAVELGEFLSPWLGEFRAGCLVVGGSIARAWDLIEPDLRPALAPVDSLELVTVAARIDDAPLLGAALHATAGGAW